VIDVKRILKKLSIQLFPFKGNQFQILEAACGAVSWSQVATLHQTFFDGIVIYLFGTISSNSPPLASTPLVRKIDA
jgi:hypothetical protein